MKFQANGSAGMAVPVTKSDARLARKTALPAKSSGTPRRTAGVHARTRSCRPGNSVRACRVRSVSIQPGRCDVGLDRQHLCPEGLQRLSGRGVLQCVAPGDHERVTGGRQPLRHAQPDAAVAAGDDSCTATQIQKSHHPKRLQSGRNVIRPKISVKVGLSLCFSLGCART